MRPTAWILVLLLAGGLSAHAAGPVMSRCKLKALTIESLNDGIPSGWCGRAMLSLLKKSGLGDGLKGGNGQDWEHILSAAGWKPVRVRSPHRAPLGSVLVYLGDRRVGKALRGTRGGRFGHVEMVSLAPTGGRIYVADMPRVRPGGTVPDNFTGRAWVPPRTLLASAPPIAEQISAVLDERLQMAHTFFSDRESRFAKLEVDSPPGGLRRID
jgi:hypothetical protein